MQDILLIISVMNLYPDSFIAAKSIAEEGAMILCTTIMTKLKVAQL